MGQVEWLVDRRRHRLLYGITLFIMFLEDMRVTVQLVNGLISAVLFIDKNPISWALLYLTATRYLSAAPSFPPQKTLTFQVVSIHLKRFAIHNDAYTVMLMNATAVTYPHSCFRRNYKDCDADSNRQLLADSSYPILLSAMPVWFRDFVLVNSNFLFVFFKSVSWNKA